MTATTTDNGADNKPDNGPATAISGNDRYMAAIKAELIDLEPEEVEDLTDDLQVHLAELALESDEPVEQLLGPPAAFAAELRQSAGFGPPPPKPPSRRLLAEMMDRVGHRIRDRARLVAQPFLDTPFGREAAAFVPELRPGWWVLRGYLLAVLLGIITSFEPISMIGVPKLFGSVVLGFFAALGLIVASVRFGRQGGGLAGGRLLKWIGGTLAVLGALVLFGQAGGTNSVYLDEGPSVYPDEGPTVFYSGQPGEMPANIHAYLPDGTPLDQVLLFNESGEPINLPEEGYSEFLGREFQAPPQQDLDGNPVENLYPRQLEEFDFETGRFTQVDPPRVGFPYLIEPGPQTGDQAEEPLEESTTTSTTEPTSTSRATSTLTSEPSSATSEDVTPSTAEGEGS